MQLLLRAAQNMDWTQIVLNGGPPCFHLEGDKFCGRAERWDGHDCHHKFISLENLLEKVFKKQENDKIADM